ncbi:MAG: hypothetical protein HQL03_02265 [Nitrospirae bacterium]|nr:hypothetical protein [Nitrospirota bacterium]
MQEEQATTSLEAQKSETTLESKASGRKSPKRIKFGTANQVMESMRYNPIAELVIIAGDVDVDDGLRVKILMELAQYVYPKLKSNESEQVKTAETYEERLKRIQAAVSGI